MLEDKLFYLFVSKNNKNDDDDDDNNNKQINELINK